MDASSQMKAPNNHGTMDESQSDSEDSSSVSFSSSMSCEASDDIDDYVSSTSLASSATSSEADGPLYEMDSLRAHLPSKRGLSKFFTGKSQSFTSLSDVRCLNDLVKPENPYRKKLKSSHSYGAGLNCQRSYGYPPQQKPRCSAKKPHKGNSVSPNKRSYLLDRPPVTPLKNMLM
ncbi:hypothetical protein KI387_013075 [Taxus chinensis]|uniref:Oxidative stress 3 n=1 Tax=Taxus chinensis TaxID=29808 RepID=A0AA38CQ58_TAXCH|nr:hypothetical protein KI387_013075 [Taxus chinensis]